MNCPRCEELADVSHPLHLGTACSKEVPVTFMVEGVVIDGERPCWCITRDNVITLTVHCVDSTVVTVRTHSVITARGHLQQLDHEGASITLDVLGCEFRDEAVYEALAE